MIFNPNKKPTHVVVVGFFENEYTWKTEYCVPFFNEESAVKYRNDMIQNIDTEYIQLIILPCKL